MKALPLPTPRILTLLAAAWMGLAPALAQSSDSDWQRCRLMPDPAARLACYDSVVLPAPGTAGPAGVTPAAAVERFGLEQKQAMAGAADEISSSLPGVFEGWRANSQFALANGQVWRVDDGSRATYDAKDPKVTVRRGVFGAFYLQIEGLNKTVRVKRVQ